MIRLEIDADSYDLDSDLKSRIEDRIGSLDEFLDFLPVELLLGEALDLFTMRLRELQEQYTDEHVQEEETTDNNEDDEVDDGERSVDISRRTSVSVYSISSLYIDIGPTLETGHDEQRDESVHGRVEVVIKQFPRAASVLALILRVKLLRVLGTIEELAT